MWFDSSTAGLVGGMGGLVGGMGGLLGGLIGCYGAMAGIFGRKGKFKKIILASGFGFIVLGVILLCVGLFALVTGQPYHVWYPFTLLGGLFTLILIPNYIVLKKVYTQAELKKMNVDDLT